MSDESTKFKDKTKSETILEDIESNLRSCLLERESLKKKYEEKITDTHKKLEREIVEINQWVKINRQEADKVVNKLILLWDYWNRECEIFKLERKIQLGVLPSEREEIMKEISKLNKINITLEKGLKERKIDPNLITKLRKKIGIWDDEED